MMHDRNDPSQYVPLLGDMIAEPPLDARVVPLLDNLPAELSRVYTQPKGLFREEREAASILQRQNRCFSRVLGTQTEYAR